MCRRRSPSSAAARLALPLVQPTTRVTILELLVRMLPIGDAAARAAANDASARAAASCTLHDGEQTAARCRELADALARSL